ncbi:MAG: cyclophilin family peptidyl-prolyl cis-trans isomerase [Planctomycetota bacterium]|jgi:cyclophilin family peptidyl-prolyl cis-trans isomerase
MKVMSALLIVMFVALPSAFAQQDNNQADLLSRWDYLAREVKQVKSRLNSMQIRFNGTEDSAKRDEIEKQYNATCVKYIGEVKTHLQNVTSFLKKNPDSIVMRDRRATDTVFSWMDSSMRAQDCEILYKQTKQPKYLEACAKFHEQGYRYAACAEVWGRVITVSANTENHYSHGTALMNNLDFEGAKKTFLAGLPRAKDDKEKKKLTVAAQFAQDYINDWPREKKLRDAARQKNDLPIVEIVTDRGTITLELFEDEAPNTVANFITLAEKSFYDDGRFHRVMANFMIQGGDPTGTGGGGPGYKIMDECGEGNGHRFHYAGSLSMAKPGNQPNSGGSQFFITSGVTGPLNGRHTVFGRVLKGIEITHVKALDVSKIGLPFNIKSIKVLKKRDHEYKVVKIDS